MSAFRSKPDPEEPWRFVCPRCKSQVHRGRGDLLYFCHHCNVGGFEKSELYDKKRGERITQ